MTERADDERLDAEITELSVLSGDQITTGTPAATDSGGEDGDEVVASDATDDPHVIEDLAAGQGRADDPTDLPVEDVIQLATIRDPIDQTAVMPGEDVDRLGEITDVDVYQGNLEARPRNSDQPDEPDVENLELLLEEELRDGETSDAGVAAEEGLTWVPPTDPPVVAGDHGQPEVAAGFGVTADDEPFDADHHDSGLSGLDERTDRIREALHAHAQTVGLVDRLRFDTIGSRVLVEGSVDDLEDEEAVLGVIAEVEGVTEVVNRIEVTSVG